MLQYMNSELINPATACSDPVPVVPLRPWRHKNLWSGLKCSDVTIMHVKYLMLMDFYGLACIQLLSWWCKHKHRLVLSGNVKSCREQRETMDNDIDSLLLRQFSSMATQDRDVLIAEFRRLLGNQLNELACSFYLEMNNWSVSLRTN